MISLLLKNLDETRLSSMLFDQDKSMSQFDKDHYETAFHKYFDEYKDIYQQIEEDYQSVSNPTEYLENLTDFFIDSTAKQKESLNKGKKDAFQIDCNMVVVTYFLPAVKEFRGTFQDEFIQVFVTRWNQAFKQHINAGSFESINYGFKRKLCYVTTAVCNSLGKSTDCYELNLLKSYRDQYLALQPNGDSLIHEYYNIAPTIVNRINKCTDSDSKYNDIYCQYISPCISLIEQGENEACQELYTEMIRVLQKEYMFHQKES